MKFFFQQKFRAGRWEEDKVYGEVEVRVLGFGVGELHLKCKNKLVIFILGILVDAFRIGQLL